jgi:hypothetical protein
VFNADAILGVASTFPESPIPISEISLAFAVLDCLVRETKVGIWNAVVQPISLSIREDNQEVWRRGRKSSEYVGQGANCPAGIVF